MSYQHNPNEAERIRQRIRQIYKSHQMNPNYNAGGGMRGMRGSAPLIEARRQAYMARNPEYGVGGYRRKKKKSKRRKSRSSGGIFIGDPYIESSGAAYVGGARPRKPKNPRKVASGKKSAKTNPWIYFYKKWLEENPDIRGRRAMKEAAFKYQGCKRLMK